jgi:hypothetical protein
MEVVMPNSNPESLVWLDNLASLTAQLEKTPDASHASLARAIKLHKSMVTFLFAIKACFDPSDKAGLKCGDIRSEHREDHARTAKQEGFGSGAASPSPILYAASSSDWSKAQIAKNSGMSTTFSPKLRKVILTAF